MPWHIETRGDEFCVIKDADGSSEGCHPNKDDASAQMRALYASENKEQEDSMSGEDSTKTFVAVGPDVPLTLSELEDLRDAEMIRHKFAYLADDYLMIASNILYSAEISDKGAALSALSQEFVGRLSDLGKGEVKEFVEKAVWSTAYKNDLPDSAFLYIESGGDKDDEGKTKPRSLRHFPVKDANGKPDVAHLRNAIAQASKAKDKNGKPLSDAIVSRVQKKARAMLKDVSKETGFWRSVVDKARSIVSGDDAIVNDDNGTFFVWKDKETGLYQWFAIYSNNFRDDDRPPEILSSHAHEEFIDAVDKGLWPLPELWLWHVPGSRVGRASVVTYDKDSGFAMAAGVFDLGMEHIAEALACKGSEISVSHGMPSMFIERDPDDPTIITRYRTREISPLPDWAAANKSTGFLIMNKEVDTMIPEEKAKFLASMGIDVEGLTAKLAETKAALEAEGVESKEIEDETEETEETEDVQTNNKDEDVEDEETSAHPDPVAPTISIEAVAAAVQIGVEAAMESVNTQIKEISDRLAAYEKQAEELDSMTPASSDNFASLLRSAVLGQESTKVDGRSKEARRAGPQETDPIPEGSAPFDIVNILKAGGDWRSVVSDKMS